MTENQLKGLPFTPLEVLDQDGPLAAEQLEGILAGKATGEGASIMVRSKSGLQNTEAIFFIIEGLTQTRENSSYSTLIELASRS